MPGFQLNRGFERELAASAEMQAEMRAKAELVKAEAERIGREIKAPWMPRKGSSETFVVAQQGPVTAVVNRDFLGHLMEWGWIRSGPRAPLRRAARAAGLTLR
jgi:hypothetical protein